MSAPHDHAPETPTLDAAAQRAVALRHDPRRRILVDQCGPWTFWALPHGSPAWHEAQAAGALDLLVCDGTAHISMVTPSRATGGRAEVCVGTMLGRFCGVECAAKWLIREHGLAVPAPARVVDMWVRIVLMHSMFSGTTAPRQPALPPALHVHS